MNQVIQTPEQQHYLAKFLGYEYTIRYRPGSVNGAADALSRLVTPGQCLILSAPQLECMTDLKNSIV